MMKIKQLGAAALFILLSAVVMAQSPWFRITVPSVSEAAESFTAPPAAYGAIHWAIWGGQQTKERVVGKGYVTLPLELGAYEARFIIIGPAI